MASNAGRVYQKCFQTTMVKVVVGKERAFYAHEGILSKSTFFERALNGGFKESTTHEIELPEDEPSTFSSILEYLYGEEYSPRIITKKERRKLHRSGSRYDNGGEGSTVEIEVKTLPEYTGPDQLAQKGEAALEHAKVYCLAEKLGLEALQSLALEKLRLSGPVGGAHFIRVAACLIEGSSDIDGVVSAFLEPFFQGIPEPKKLPME